MHCDTSQREARTRMRRRRVLGRPSVIALAVVAVTASAPSAWSLTGGDAAPACSAPLLDGSRTLSLAEFRGKVVYLDFWASWCLPCRQTFPFMNELQRELDDRGLSIVAVSVDKTAEEARGFLAKYPAQFTTAVDTAGACPKAYELQGMPSSYLIDRNGTVRSVHVGFRAKDKAAIRAELLQALGESR